MLKIINTYDNNSKNKYIQAEQEYSLRNKLPFEYVENYNIFRSGIKKIFNLRVIFLN